MICSAELGLNVSDRVNPSVSAYKPYFDVPYLYESDPNFTNTDWFESDIVISALVWQTLHPAHDSRGCIPEGGGGVL